MNNQTTRYPSQSRETPLRASQRRIQTIAENRQLQEMLVDRSQPLPIDPEVLLKDLSVVYMGMMDARYPFN